LSELFKKEIVHPDDATVCGAAVEKKRETLSSAQCPIGVGHRLS
jgi:hypothetical protein